MAGQDRVSSKTAFAVAIESLAKSFQEQLGASDAPAIEDYLKVAPAEAREELFARLLDLEVGLRAAAGETLSADEWKRRFPSYAAQIERALRFGSGDADETANIAAQALEGTIDYSSSGDADDGVTKSLKRSPKSVSRSPRTSEQAGRQFGDYELLGELARGGMGVVYKARQAKLNRIVAVKMILAGQLASDEDVQRFYSEAEAAARLDHPGIVPIYEVGELDGRHFFSMGFVDGASLHDEVSKGPLPQRRAAELVRQIADAVEYAHRHGIVHRDLKPRNILLASDGRPKVTDFGLAKQADSGVELTVSGQVLGTPAYMPPEQAGGHLSQIGPRSDVYSLGGVLYFLLVGRPPFQAATLAETLSQVLETPPVAPRLLNPSVDRDLETICLKCLEKNPAHRYATAEELADELGRYLVGEPIRARRIGPVARTIRWARRRPLAAALIGSLATLLIVIGVAGTAGAEVVGQLRTSELERRLEERIAVAEPTEEYLAEMDRLLAELRPRSVESSETFRKRTDQAFAEAVRRDLRRPTLEAAAIAEAETAIALLEPRNSELADALIAELDRRRRDWQQVFELAAPFANAGEVFPGSVRTTVEPSAEGGEGLRVEASDGQPTRRVLANFPSAGAVRLRATFDVAWRNAVGVVGVLLEADAATGYQFAIESLPVPASDDEAREKLLAMSLGERLQQEGVLVAVIRRNGDPLVRRTIEARDLVDGPLTITATRAGGEIRMQANSLPPLSFDDPFPIRTRGAFGLIWPTSVVVLGLEASRQPAPEATSPLEQGDESFDRGEFAAALEQYQIQELQSEDGSIRQECRFKQGMSLFELGRYEEAATKFEEVLYEEGGRWPPLAGARLWALQLRQRRQDEADGTFDLLSSKYDFSRFAPLIPAQIRDEISAAYKTNLYAVSEAMRFDPDRLSEVQRAAAVDRYFSEDGRGDPMVQIDVARAYSLMGDLDNAVRAAEPVALNTRHSTVLRHYVRFLRLAGDAEAAKGRLEAFLRRYPEIENTDLMLAIERARIYAALGDWTRCEAEVDEFYRRHRAGEAVSPGLMTFAALIKGELLERQGAFGPAKEVRRQAFEAAMPVIARQATSKTEVLHAMILGSLGEAADDAQMRQLFAVLLNDGGDNAIVRQAQAMIDPNSLGKALREMWRSPLGRSYAEAFAFETIALRDRIKAPVSLAAVEYVDQTTMRGEMSPDQEKVAFDTIGSAIEAMLHEGSIQMGQIVQLALTWKGQSGFIGWGAVGPTLDPQLRAGFAYTFAHRYVAIGNEDQAIKFLTTAEKDAPEGSLLQRLASLDRRALERNEGFLAVRYEAPGPVKLAVTVAGSQEIRQLVAEDGAEIPIPAGDVTIALVDAPPGVVLETSQARVAPAGRTPIVLRAIWAPANEGTSLRGLIPRPSTAAVGSRWQIVYRDSAQRPLDVAWSGDGARFAVASEDGFVRIYPADGSEPESMLFAPMGLKHVRWAPSVDRILGAGDQLPICGWDANTGARLFYDRGEYGYSNASWRSDAKQFVTSTSYGGKRLRIWDADGRLLLAPPQVQEGSDFAAISPDGNEAVIRVWRGDYADLHLYDLRDASAAAPTSLTGPGESQYLTGAFSPDGRFFVAGSRSSELSLWKAGDWSRQRIEAPDHWVERIVWSQDSARFLVLSNNAQSMIFDATTDPPTLTTRVETPRLAKGDVSPDWGTIAFVEPNANLHRVRMEDSSRETFGVGARALHAIAVSQDPSPRIAVGGAESHLRLFDEQGRQIATMPAAGESAVVALAWSPAGDRLVGLAVDRCVYFWSTAGELLGKFDAQARTDPPTLDWSDDGAALRVVTENGKLLEVNPNSGPRESTTVGPVTALDETILAFARSQRGSHAFVTAGGRLFVERGEGAEAATLDLPEWASIRRVVWSPDDTLAMIDSGGDLWFLAPASTAPVRAAVRQADARSIAWSPDGTRLAAAYADGLVQVWLAEGQTLIAENELPSEAEARDLCWLDDRRLAVVGRDGALRFAVVAEDRLAWETTTLALPEEGWARFSPGGERLESEGDVENALRYVIETPAATLELLRPSQFAQRLAAAAGRDPSQADSASQMTAAPSDPNSVEDSLSASPAEADDLATVGDERIAESSGLALCSSRPDALWTHNDSGDPELFLIDLRGQTLARVRIPEAECVDWEDCSRVSFESKKFLLIADTGDNLRNRPSTELYLVAEPEASGLAEESDLSVAKRWTISFEHGPRDCEAIAFDSQRGVLLMLTKEIERESELYEAKLDFSSDEPVTARRVSSRELPSVTSMDLSPDGSRLAVLTMSHVWEFDRTEGEGWDAALQVRPRVYALPSGRQYEAVAYGADGRTMFLTSEGARQPLVELSPSER